MYKLIILIENSTSPEFEEHWPQFLHLVEKMPGLRRESTSHVDHIVLGDFPYNLIHELYFDSLEAIQAAMATADGKAAGRLLQIMTGGKVILLFADHKEDVPENIRKYREPGQDD
jgi:uncharacterized protein (TIGR02118 family)